MNTEVLTTKNTWAILCTPAVGTPFPEYVEGTHLTSEGKDIHIWDEKALVRTYPAGTWSNFCEWVAVPELHRLDIIRVASPQPRNVRHELPDQRGR